MLNTINSYQGILALVLFAITYLFVITEEFTNLKKSKPVVLASGIIWLLVGIAAANSNQSALAEAAAKHNILEFAQLFLFLLVAMTYVNVMQERKIFDALRSYLIDRGYSLKKLFWISGLIAFFLSPLVDNLTTALIMGSVIIAVGKSHPKFVALSCINIVVAANAGGVFSPFGDITTLMVWQADVLNFSEFFKLFAPSLISYLVPAVAMSIFIPNIKPNVANIPVTMQFGSNIVIILFMLTIITAVLFRALLGLPPVLGMMMGLGYLKLFGYYLKISKHHMIDDTDSLNKLVPFDIIKKIQHIEWDTMLFFYGIMLCIGGLATFGYLEYLSHYLYRDLNLGLLDLHAATPANAIIGLLSALLGNIPIMFSVITMNPDMSTGQWLLVTLTTGIGGSILAIGSAAGIALLGQAQGKYTFFSHLKWTPAILLGYCAGVMTHIFVNFKLF